jgi:DNA polymerase-3 subunit chi
LTGAATRIDFYVLDQAGVQARLRFACRLTEKAFQQRHHIHALTVDEAMARTLDELLWTFRAESFVPHGVANGEATAELPVTIGWEPDRPAQDGDLLINLTPGVPTSFESYRRLAEIVDADEACRREGRERFRFYRDNGFEPQTHRIA